RRRQPAALLVGDDLRVLALHDRHDRVRGPQVDSDDLAHFAPSSSPVGWLIFVSLRELRPGGQRKHLGWAVKPRRPAALTSPDGPEWRPPPWSPGAARPMTRRRRTSRARSRTEPPARSGPAWTPSGAARAAL